MNLSHPLSTYWRPYNDVECAPFPSYLPALWRLSHGDSTPRAAFDLKQFSPDKVALQSLTLGAASPLIDSMEAIRFLRYTRPHIPTILILGDSVDRNGVVQFCQLMKGKMTMSHYHNMTQHPPDDLAVTHDYTVSHGPPFEGWDQRGLPHLCEIERYREDKSQEKEMVMRVVNGFHYGMDDEDEYNTAAHADWHKPGLFEDRITQLILPMVQQLGGVESIDVVSLHSGMWDVVRFSLVFFFARACNSGLTLLNQR